MAPRNGDKWTMEHGPIAVLHFPKWIRMTRRKLLMLASVQCVLAGGLFFRAWFVGPQNYHTQEYLGGAGYYVMFFVMVTLFSLTDPSLPRNGRELARR